MRLNTRQHVDVAWQPEHDTTILSATHTNGYAAGCLRREPGLAITSHTADMTGGLTRVTLFVYIGAHTRYMFM